MTHDEKDIFLETSREKKDNQYVGFILFADHSRYRIPANAVLMRVRLFRTTGTSMMSDFRLTGEVGGKIFVILQSAQSVSRKEDFQVSFSGMPGRKKVCLFSKETKNAQSTEQASD